MPRLLLAFAAMAALVGFASPTTAAGADAPQVMVQDLERLAAFVSGTALTNSDREALAAEVAHGMSTDAAGARKSAAAVEKFFDGSSKMNPLDLAGSRESFRLGVALLPTGDPLRAVVEDHDPAIVFNRAKKFLVTEATLRAWQDAAVYVTKRLAVRGPDADFVDRERAAVRGDFTTYSDDQRDALTHVARNYAVARQMLERADDTTIRTAVAKDRAEANDHARLPMNVAIVVQAVYRADIDQMLVRGMLINGAENFSMLYRAGYSSGIYR